jgi:hypothetical protein
MRVGWLVSGGIREWGKKKATNSRNIKLEQTLGRNFRHSFSIIRVGWFSRISLHLSSRPLFKAAKN